MKDCIFLTGFMGSGKTTIGKALANRLDFDFIDLDEMIVDKLGMPIADFFREEGESRFRIIERQLLHKVSEMVKRPTVIALGGGVPCYFNNADFINKNGQSIYLRMSPEDLLTRLLDQRKERPLMSGLSKDKVFEYISVKLSERKAYYEMAHHIIDGHQPLDQLVKELEKIVIN